VTGREPRGVSPARIETRFQRYALLGGEFLGLRPRLSWVMVSPLKTQRIFAQQSPTSPVGTYESHSFPVFPTLSPTP
jgi:hypothetical protein